MKEVDDKLVNILLMEDDDIDAKGLMRAFKKHQISNPVTRVTNGLEGLKLLRSNAVPKPLIVLLDLNMPRMNGIEFLNELRNDEQLKETVVFVLTTSHSEVDLLAAYERNIAGYIVKTNLKTSFDRLIEMLTSYWNISELPPNKRVRNP
ncbi:response regulator [Aliiglaciecola litoralis]|uniref:Response regulator n=1 Tax=Aliiglaciecola litoralis TaxID=582857 RepID=A0ABN1LEP7_9ALTE